MKFQPFPVHVSRQYFLGLKTSRPSPYPQGFMETFWTSIQLSRSWYNLNPPLLGTFRAKKMSERQTKAGNQITLSLSQKKVTASFTRFLLQQ